MNGLYKFTRLYNVSVVFDTSNKPFIKKCGLKTYKYKIQVVNDRSKQFLVFSCRYHTDCFYFKSTRSLNDCLFNEILKF